jgi:hypothetical protein
MLQTTTTSPRQVWQEAWAAPAFRRLLFAGVVMILAILSIFPFYFQWIEHRHGIVINDFILRELPRLDVSIPLFIVIWGLSLLAIVRAVYSPRIFMTFIWAWIPLTLCRFLTITLIPLDPPAGLIGLTDPLSNFFYGPSFVTKDLFFSGHTSTVFLVFLCLPGKRDKLVAMMGTLVVGILLLVQHVHYTLDVLFAFPFGYLFWWISSRIILRNIWGPMF